MRRLALAALLCCSCVEDAGMIEGVVGPIVTPLEVLNVQGTVDADVLSDAVALWNDASPLPLFVEVDEIAGLYGWATVELAEVPIGWQTPDGTAGAAWIELTSLGEVRACVIAVDPEYTYTQATYTRTVAHELGHCLGLADDPRSLDLGSVMSDPPHHGARPTEHDIDCVLHGCNP